MHCSGFGLVLTLSMRLTCSSSMRRPKFRSRTSWWYLRRPRPSSFSAILNNSVNPQGTHPDGVDTSALDHMLAGHQTIPEDRGLFLEETWRLHPAICAFTSELFYEGRLHPRAGLELQEIRSTSVLNGSGLRYLPVAHTANQSSSVEEAEVVRALVSDFLALNPTWVNREGLNRL